METCGSGASDGMWRSLVAHHNGVVGVAGSNPVIPMLCIVESLE